MLSLVPSRRVVAVRRAGVLVALAVLLTALGVAPAAAHNALRSTDPADGSTVVTAPAQVTLTFDQAAMELGTQVVVTGPDGVVSDGAVQLVDASVVQPLVATLPAGQYTVDWRVTSADGHPLSGSLTFTATEAAGVPAPADTPSGTPSAATAPSDATPTPTVVSEPTPPPNDVTAAPVTDPLVQDGPPVWVWVALGAGVLAALAGGAVAVLAAQRRADAADAADPDGAPDRP